MYETFSLSHGSGFGKNVITFGVDNGKKKIIILSKGSTDGLDHTTIRVEVEYSINFSEQQKKFCLALHYNGSSSYFLSME